MNNTIIQTIVLITLTFFLTGCYEVKEAIYKSGHKVPFIGTYTCSGMMGKVTTYKIEEKKSWLSTSISHTITDVKTGEVDTLSYGKGT